jgi:hypothetical protein
MTLPFRRRHHDDEGSHDRARALITTAFTDPLGEVDAAWLEAHLGRCPECRSEREALVADRALLRGLRDHMPAPPRDLWARTAAAIEQQRRPGHRPAGRPRFLPVGATSVALVVLVVVASALLQGRGIAPFPSTTESAGVARASVEPAATPLIVQAGRVAWVQAAPDGSYGLVFADVDHACPGDDPTCAPLADSSPAPLALAAPPQAVVLAPGQDQVAVVGPAADSSRSVVIVNVPTPRPVPTATDRPVSTASVQPSNPPATREPSVTPTGSPAASSSASPGSGQVIARDVAVVGAVAYSADGEWLAFSARPLDGVRGPDLFVWHAGDVEAHRITDDGATYFTGWYGERIVASRVLGASPLDADPGTASATPDGASPDPSAAAPSASPASAEAHPVSFLLDPSTGEEVQFGGLDVWMPSIDPSGRFVAYWAGTVGPADAAVLPLVPAAVAAWRPATGHLVLDGWSGPLSPLPSPDASAGPASAEPPGPPGSPASHGAPSHAAPSNAATPPGGPVPAAVAAGAVASGAPSSGAPVGAVLGPAGTPIELAHGPIADFDVQFDPTGTRLAVWVLDAPDASAGRLWLVALDATLGALNPALNPMGAPGVPALRGFSIDSGRLGWVTPAGQDGQPSSVQVLAWKGDDFGQVQSVPGGTVQLVR